MKLSSTRFFVTKFGQKWIFDIVENLYIYERFKAKYVVKTTLFLKDEKESFPNDLSEKESWRPNLICRPKGAPYHLGRQKLSCLGV